MAISLSSLNSRCNFFFFSSLLLSSVTHNWHSLRSRERGTGSTRKCMQNQKHFSLSPPPLNLPLLLETRGGGWKRGKKDISGVQCQNSYSNFHMTCNYSNRLSVERKNQTDPADRVHRGGGAVDEDDMELCASGPAFFFFLQSGRHFQYRWQWQAWWSSSSWERESTECNISRVSNSLVLYFFLSLLIATFKISRRQINYPSFFNPFFRAISLSSAPVEAAAAVTILSLSLQADLTALE